MQKADISHTVRWKIKIVSEWSWRWIFDQNLYS